VLQSAQTPSWHASVAPGSRSAEHVTTPFNATLIVP